jgi:rhodanese-related sulfurtransferase
MSRKDEKNVSSNMLLLKKLRVWRLRGLACFAYLREKNNCYEFVNLYWNINKKGGPMGEITGKIRVGCIVSTAILLILFLFTAQATANGPLVNQDDKEGTISIVSFKKIIDENPESILLIDVREPEEYEKGRLKTAINIPIDDLEDRIDSFPVDKPVVYICETGERSGEAYDITVLLRDDLRVYYLDAEITFDKQGTYKIGPIEK